MDIDRTFDPRSLGEHGYLSAALDLAHYHEAPSQALRWRIARDYELAGDLPRARHWYQALAAEAAGNPQTFATLAALRLAEISDVEGE